MFFSAFVHPETEVIVLVSDKRLPGRPSGLWVAVSNLPQPDQAETPVAGLLRNGRADGGRHIFPNDMEDVVVAMLGTKPTKVTLGGVPLKPAPWVVWKDLVFQGPHLQAVRQPQ